MNPMLFSPSISIHSLYFRHLFPHHPLFSIAIPPLRPAVPPVGPDHLPHGDAVGRHLGAEGLALGRPSAMPRSGGFSGTGGISMKILGVAQARDGWFMTLMELWIQDDPSTSSGSTWAMI